MVVRLDTERIVLNLENVKRSCKIMYSMSQSYCWHFMKDGAQH